MGLIDGELNTLHSLRPRHIIFKDNNFVVSSALCLNRAATNPNYLAPEELDPSIVIAQDA
jgi:hypothetical protein